MKKIIIFLTLMSLICILSACGHEHVWGEWKILQEATCIAEGLKEHTCECGKTETITISKSNHSWGIWKQDKPCDFYEYIRCINCGEEKEHRIAEKQHDYDDKGYCLDCKKKVYYPFEEVRQIIQVNQVSIAQHNSSGIHDLKIVWQNKSAKSVKEIVFTVSCYYNGKEYTENYSSNKVVEPGKIGGQDTLWDEYFPSTGVTEEHIESISIEYTDGTNIHIHSNSIEYAMKGYGDVKLDGVIYSLSDDAKSYFVTGGYENNIIIHSTVNGKPVTKIDGWSFKEKKSLTNVVIEEGITEIGDYAFAFCEKLSNIQFPNSIVKIGSSAFTYTLWEQNQSDGILYIGKVLYKYIGTMPSNTTVRVSEGIVSVSNGAFGDVLDDNCKGLVSLYLPSTLREISRKAFYDCDSLSYIEIAKSNPIYHSAGNCIIETNSKTLVFGCKNSTIPTNGSVAIIGEGAFYDCYYLTQISIPDSVKEIENSAFYGCNKLSSVSIGNGVVEIGAWAFKDCSELSNVSLGTSVQIIGEECFYECYDLTHIVLPDSIKRIEKSAFQATNLVSITIGQNLEFIGEKAFSFYGLKDIHFNGTKAQWNSIEKGDGWQPWSSYTVHCSNGDIK